MNIQELAVSFQKQSQSIYIDICENRLNDAREKIQTLNNWSAVKFKELADSKFKEVND